MSKLNLFQTTQYFNKLAGILKVPQELYNELLKWTVKIFCGKTLYKINEMLRQNQENIKKLNEIKIAKQSEDFKYFYEWFDRSNINKVIDHILSKKTFNIQLPNFSIHHFIDNEGPVILINIEGNQYSEYYAGPYENKNNIIKFFKKNCDKINEITYEFINQNDLDYFTDKYILELNTIKKMCLQHTTEEIEDDLVIMEEFEYKNITLYLNIVFNQLHKEIIYAEEDWGGLYSTHVSMGEMFSKIHLFIGQFEIYQFQTKLKEISEILRHEVQHFIQQVIKMKKNLDEHGGLPKQQSIRRLKKRKYDIHGNEILEKETSQSKTISENKSKRLEHKLRDIEYTTNLTDKIAELKTVLSKFSEKFHDIFIKYFINQISYEEFEEKFLPEFKKMYPKINSKYFHFMNIYPIQYSLLNEGRKYFNFLYENDKQKWKWSIKDLYKEINLK